MDKKDLSERDICTKYITPALKQAGWEDYNKLWFTIMDFKKATELFTDPDFDGEPVVIYEPISGGSSVPPEGGEGGSDTGGEELESYLYKPGKA